MDSHKEEEINIEQEIISLLKNFGIDKEAIASFKPLAQKAIIDFLRGAPKFIEEEKRIEEVMRRNIKEEAELLVKNIYSVRNFILTLMGFSLTIVGIVSPNRAYFHHEIILGFGLAALGLYIICSVLFLLYIHTTENRKHADHLNFNRVALKDIKALLLKIYSDPTKNIDNYLSEKEKLIESKKKEEEAMLGKISTKGSYRYIVYLCFLFLGGLLLIAISFFWQ
ncbi:MAG: hypothetical protein PHC82_01830 [Candidatus Pacebacteria bacterium]|nr:hypothetical protein [Candidatus Paceibacterota bacterium]